jgi:hypothetical protein
MPKTLTALPMSQYATERELVSGNELLRPASEEDEEEEDAPAVAAAAAEVAEAGDWAALAMLLLLLLGVVLSHRLCCD